MSDDARIVAFGIDETDEGIEASDDTHLLVASPQVSDVEPVEVVYELVDGSWWFASTAGE